MIENEFTQDVEQAQSQEPQVSKAEPQEPQVSKAEPHVQWSALPLGSALPLAPNDGRNDRAMFYAKIARAMGKMNRIPKNGFNAGVGSGFAYATNEDVADMVRAALVEQGIAFFVDMGKVETTSHTSSDRFGNVKEVIKTRVHFIFTFADGETGYAEERHWIGEALGHDDKSLSKCATAAQKYFLLKTFIISTGNEPDPDGDGEAQGKQSKSQRPRQPQAQAQAAQGSQAKSQPAQAGQGKAQGKPAQSQPAQGSAQVNTQELSPLPQSPKDLKTYFEVTAPHFSLTREQAANTLKGFDGDAVKAYQALKEQAGNGKQE